MPPAQQSLQTPAPLSHRPRAEPALGKGDAGEQSLLEAAISSLLSSLPCPKVRMPFYNRQPYEGSSLEDAAIYTTLLNVHTTDSGKLCAQMLSTLTTFLLYQ